MKNFQTHDREMTRLGGWVTRYTQPTDATRPTDRCDRFFVV